MGEDMMDFTKISLESFLQKDYEKPDIDSAIIVARQNHSLHRQLLDVWGEVDSTMQLYDKCKKKKANIEDVQEQLESVHNACYTIYSNPRVTEGAKWELKVAEWELYDFILWDNTWNNTRKTVTGWFDEWCYIANPEA